MVPQAVAGWCTRALVQGEDMTRLRPRDFAGTVRKSHIFPLGLEL